MNHKFYSTSLKLLKMVFKCEHCDFSSGEIDEEMVCPSCGIVYNETEITENVPYQERTSKKWTSYNASRRKGRCPQGLSMGLAMIKTLTSVYHANPEMAQKATSMFQEANKLKYYHTVDDNRILAGSCFYIVLRENNYPVLISDLCAQIQCKIHRFNIIYKKIRSATNVDIQPQKTEDFVGNILNCLPEKEKQQIIQKTRSLVALSQSCWISCGRSPRNLIIAAAFICWKSMNRNSDRQSFAKFCADHKFGISPSNERVEEILKMLVKLASNISSPNNSQIHKKNVFCFLDYILSHSESLRNDLLAREHSVANIDKKEFSSFRKATIKKICAKESCNNEEINASDVEISDSEISQYIRTEEEVAAVEKIQAANNLPQ